jgi:hypothetical protein
MTTSERIEANANLTLWCVHVLGPDDVLAAPSHEAAAVHAHNCRPNCTISSGRMKMTDKPKGKERHCWNCGENMGFVEDRHWSRGDTCGKRECEREALAQDEAERDDAHERLDRDQSATAMAPTWP